jgi:glutamate synthase domain-containing protein 2/glutamate synthase domain-containing protein 1/glutamate synthase domain-containing protein 3
MQTREIFQKKGLYDPRFEHDACGVGFVCDIRGRASHEIVRQGITVLERLSHRGATGADPKTGDGAGILIQIPHAFLAEVTSGASFTLPAAGSYGTGLVFLPVKKSERAYCKRIFASILEQEGLKLLGWREVPVDNSGIGVTARATQPVIEQIFVMPQAPHAGARIKGLDLERALYVVRKLVENTVRQSAVSQKNSFYITNLSSRTLLYKGLLMPQQLEQFFPDLEDERCSSGLCLVHSRYSTNTFPTWDLSQPFRFLAHNGEINTLRGNINWMKAREGLLKSVSFGPKLKKLYPIIVPQGSDSAMLDNVFELLCLSGRSLPHAISMLIPAAWERNQHASAAVRDFYRYHACLMEPWDGPAAVAFTDGTNIGAVLDRNGLRPARYVVTTAGRVVMASEVGVLDIDPGEIVSSGRLEPGKLFYIDTRAGRIVGDAEIKESMARQRPYGEWLRKNMIFLKDMPGAANGARGRGDVSRSLKAFGYTREDMKTTIEPMVKDAQEPVGSMGNHMPHAVLSAKPQLLYTYFKQLFAQVTNPAVDPIREELVMTLNTYAGPERNTLEEGPDHCRRIVIEHPILVNADLEKLRSYRKGDFRARTISLLFDPSSQSGLKQALGRITREAVEAIRRGYGFIVLSDRGVDPSHAGIPALLATSCVHHALVRKSLRTQIGILVESGEPREVHHFALLFGYGADAINPYLAFDAIDHLIAQGDIAYKHDEAVYRYSKAVEKGILKVLSKMGISTLQSYRGAQIFEALGLAPSVIDDYFPGTVSRIGGIDLATIAGETVRRHHEAFFSRETGDHVHLQTGGMRQWFKDGEYQLWNPETIAALQDSTRSNDPKRYEDFARIINNQAGHPVTLRSLFRFKKCAPVPLSEVEPAESITSRFATGAMSFGSISRNAHESIAIAMNRIKGRSNTGEGGEDPARFSPLPDGDSARSSIKQVASGRFGVTTNYLVNADELQIKIAQGAKPGEGGQLPGHKVSAIIARTRYTTPGVTLISPPPHHDIYSIEELAQLIFDLKNANPRARISVKLVSEIGVGTVAAGVAKGHADMILISGADGGTGASPVSSIMHAGLPWELGLSETHQTLVLNDLRSRVRLQTDGQMRTGRDVVIAALLGAEEYGFSTSVLIVLGCVMLRHCHLNTCSVGVATQDEFLEKKFRGQPEYVVNYFRFVAEEVRRIMCSLGMRTIDEMIGRTDLLEVDPQMVPPKAKGLDLSRILFKPQVDPSVGIRYSRPQDHGIESVLDRTLIKKAAPALDKGSRVSIELPIANRDRTVGAMLSGEVCRRRGENGLGEDTIHCVFRGTAGQSFGAFLARGITFELEGMANDYIGKGMFGGRIIVYPDRRSSFTAEENIIIGNTTFYGAITGEAFIRGVAGERFCIRNSGVYAVVEGVGDHACEYMTGGRVVVLGATGRNFAAGMSGGIAYVYDRQGDFKSRCNMEMVALEKPQADDFETVKGLLADHVRYTASPLAKKIHDDFGAHAGYFVKVMPLEYKRILASQAPKPMKGSAETMSDG